MIDLDRIEAMTMLLSAVDNGSFSAAAREMKVPTSTLTRRIVDLEEFLGTRLITRTTRKLAMTDAGAAYIAAARRIVDEIREQEREAAGEFATVRGMLVISTPIQFGRLHVLPIVNQFLTSHPDIKVRLLQSDQNIDLIDGRADLAIRIGELPNSSMVATRVGSVRPVVCVSPALLEEYGIPRDPEALLKIPSVVFDSPYLSPWRFRVPETNREFALDIHPRLWVTAPDAAVQAAVDGVGATLLLEHDPAAAIDAGQLKIILERYEAQTVPVNIIHVSRNLMPLKLRRFIDFATPRLRDSLAHFGRSATERVPTAR